MVKVVKDNHMVRVTRGAYEDIYEPLGYTIVGEKKVEPKKVENDIKEETKANKEDKVEEVKQEYKRK